MSKRPRKPLSERKALKKTRNKPGRPSLITPDLAEEFLHRLCSRSLQNITDKDDDMPTDRTIYRWLLREGPEYDLFRQGFELARSFRSYGIADRMIDVVDGVLPEKNKKEGRIDPKIGHVALYGLDKAAARMMPNKKVELTGAGGKSLIDDSSALKDVQSRIDSITESIRTAVSGRKASETDE